jgi:outer membrane lipopolysaccharide assembly protein LptE/RlpB
MRPLAAFLALALLAACSRQAEEPVANRFERMSAEIENKANALEAEVANRVGAAEARIQEEIDALANRPAPAETNAAESNTVN